MKTKTAVDHYGSVAKLAAALKISRTAVYLWKDEVPEGRAYQLELMTGGALKAVHAVPDDRAKQLQTQVLAGLDEANAKVDAMIDALSSGRGA